jgi:hypothetical protein
MNMRGNEPDANVALLLIRDIQNVLNNVIGVLVAHHINDVRAPSLINGCKEEEEGLHAVCRAATDGFDHFTKLPFWSCSQGLFNDLAGVLIDAHGIDVLQDSRVDKLLIAG